MSLVEFSVAPITASVGRVDARMILRVALVVATFSMAIVSAFAAERPVLRGDVTATADVLTLADLVEGISGADAARPVFRAPALGESGTIQTRRIVEAATSLGIDRVETHGRVEIAVARAARRIGAPEIEAALKQALETRSHLDTRALSILFDGTPTLVVAPDVKTAVTAEEIVYDPRTRRVTALVTVSPKPGERRASARVSGALVELIDVAILNRALARGETVQAADITLERRVREQVPQDGQSDGSEFHGRIARRALAAGALIRAGDLARPAIVARGDAVTIVYQVPGMTLTLRGKANDGGALADTVNVLNPQSKKILQAQVAAPGKVIVTGGLPGPTALAVSH